MRWWLALQLVVTYCLTTGSAWAHSVILYYTSQGSEHTPETATRLRGELLSMNVEVHVRLGAPLSHTRPGSVAPQARDPHVDAVMAVTTDEHEYVVTIWVLTSPDEFAPLLTLRDATDVDNAPEQLAIRAAEALHSHFLQRDLAVPASPGSKPAVERPPEPTVKPASTSVAANRPPPAVSTPLQDETRGNPLVSPRAGLSVGGALLAATHGLGPTAMPLLRLEWPLTAWLGVQLTAAGLGSRSGAATSQGAVWVTPHYGVVGANYRAPRFSQLTPLLGVGIGALVCAIDARAQAPLTAHDEYRVVALLEVTLGAEVELSEHYFLTVSGHAHLTQPSLVIHVLDDPVARSGRPNFAASLAAGARL